MRDAKTYYEDGAYYGVVHLPNGHTYYIGPYKSRSTAYRHGIKETKKHQFAQRNHMVYNTRYQ